MLTKKPTADPLQKEIDRLLDLMTDENDTKEYLAMLDKVERLTKLRNDKLPKPISRDTMIVVVGNLVGILLILNHERLNVISTKAIGFVLRAK